MKKLPVIPGDKANHFIYGLFIFAIVNIIFNPIVASIVCTLFAVGKELKDKYDPRHQAELMDVIWTIFGGLIAFLIFFIK